MGKSTLAQQQTSMAAENDAMLIPDPNQMAAASAADPEQMRDDLSKHRVSVSSPMIEAGLTEALQKVIADEKDAFEGKGSKRDVRWMSTRPYLDQTIISHSFARINRIGKGETS